VLTCADLCALLNDLLLQFNDMRHGKYSTMAMIHLFMKNRKREDTSASSSKDSSKTDKKAGGANSSNSPAAAAGTLPGERASASAGLKAYGGGANSLLAKAGEFVSCVIK
jgi:hypothetical protein